jgi:hypothetical protein
METNRRMVLNRRNFDVDVNGDGGHRAADAEKGQTERL